MEEERATDMNQLFTYERDARRLELLVRIAYAWIAIAIVLVVYGFIAEICVLVQWFVILILGRRSEGISKFVKGYLEYMVHIAGYYYVMTDKRPGILPKPVTIYEHDHTYRPK